MELITSKRSPVITGKRGDNGGKTLADGVSAMPAFCDDNVD
jgi:hypothetical protein